MGVVYKIYALILVKEWVKGEGLIFEEQVDLQVINDVYRSNFYIEENERGQKFYALATVV